jgi:hypothetical protein
VALTFVWRGAYQGLEDVARFLDSITGSSRLYRLKIRFSRWDKWNTVAFRGGEFISRILVKHSDTLNVLRLPQFHPPKSIFIRIFSCPKLKELSIGVTSSLMVGF